LRATASAAATRIIADGTRARPLLNPCTGRPFHTIMSNGGFKDVQPHVSSFDPSVWVVTFTLASNNEARAFSEHTRTHINQPLAIVLDGKVLSAPIIRSELVTGGEIVGNFNREQATTLAIQLRTGALPATLIVVTIEASASGGTGILLEAAPGSNLDKDSAEQIRQVVIKRMQALNIENPKVDLKGNQLIVDVPGGIDSQPVVEAVVSRGLLEMVDFSLPSSCRKRMPLEGQYIITDGARATTVATAAVATSAATTRPTAAR
jgi:preprotein translocase subunit SecD